MNCQEANNKFEDAKDITPKREKVSPEWRLFAKMNFTTHHSSCYGIETRTSKNSDELRACIAVCKYVDNLSFLPKTLNKFVLLVILT